MENTIWQGLVSDDIGGRTLLGDDHGPGEFASFRGVDEASPWLRGPSTLGVVGFGVPDFASGTSIHGSVGGAMWFVIEGPVLQVTRCEGGTLL